MNNNKIKIAILGYGNVGKGVEKAVKYNDDIELLCIVTRRDVEKINTLTDTPVINIIDFLNEVQEWQKKIDVLILCGGSAKDLPTQAPIFAKYFNTVDSFDTHANIPQYLEQMNKSAKESNNLSVISVGWDPGMFSLCRVYSNAILPDGHTYTFWGKGVSQGHSDALKRIKGVKRAIQYTIPIDSAMEQVRNGLNPEFSARDKHLRECFVVIEPDADEDVIREEIVSMPNYFSEYNTTVNYISEQEFLEKHCNMPHGGFVIHNGKTDENNVQAIEYSLKLNSNPEFTGGILVAYARAVYRLRQTGLSAAITALDIPPIMLINKNRDDVIANML